MLSVRTPKTPLLKVLLLAAAVCGCADAAIDEAMEGAAQQTAISARSSAESSLIRRLQPARYLSQACGTPITDWPGYEGRPVVRCTYSVTNNRKTLSALVYLLNPSMANLIDRIAYACDAIGLTREESCGRRLAEWIVESNGGQFPVAGFVVEKKDDAGGRGPDPVYLEFRDGTTIMSTDRLNFTDNQLDTGAMEHAARAPISETRKYARIANASREDYRLAGGKELVGTGPATDPSHRWPLVIRANEFRAQATGVDELLRGVAIRLRVLLSEKTPDSKWRSAVGFTK